MWKRCISLSRIACNSYNQRYINVLKDAARFQRPSEQASTTGILSSCRSFILRFLAVSFLYHTPGRGQQASTADLTPLTQLPSSLGTNPLLEANFLELVNEVFLGRVNSVSSCDGRSSLTRGTPLFCSAVEGPQHSGFDKEKGVIPVQGCLNR